MIAAMSIRFLSCVAGSLFLVFSAALPAQEAGRAVELQRIQAALEMLNAEIKANAEQVLALQAALKANAQGPVRSPDLVSFDDAAAAQRRAIENEAVMNARIDVNLARNLALEEEKKPLLNRARELLQVPPGTSQ